jgi:hypothetical protein
MLDTEIKLAQCSRCQSYVWACNSAGVRVAVDPNPIMNGAEVYAFLGYGRSIYEVIYKVSKPHHLRWLGAPGTSWEPNGRILVASHGCGAAATDAVAVEVPLQGPQKAPVQPGRPSDGFPHRPALESGSRGRTRRPSRVAYSATPQSPAQRATLRRFKCDTCGGLIGDDEAFVAIEHYRYTWAVHDFDCVGVEMRDDEIVDAHYRKVKQVGYDVTQDLLRKGLVMKPIEIVELPE